MPPPEAHKTLKPEQIALLREWVKQGAQYEEHWSFLPPKHQAIPAVKHGEWVRNAIDNFVLARLEKEGFQPSPEADRRSLDPAGDLRPDGLAADPGRSGSVRSRFLSRRVREGGRPVAGKSPLRGASGALLAGRRALWGYARSASG